MASFTTADFRNIALVGHAASGKTTLVDHLLHAAGVIGKPGSVEEKNTVCDFEEEAKHHGHSLVSAVVQFGFEGKRINLVDTPGYPDFLGQSIGALPSADTAAIVIDAARGVQAVTRRMFSLARDRRLPSVIIVNKIDHAEVDLEELVLNIQETLGPQCLPVNLPVKGRTSVVDVFEHESGETDFSSAKAAHKAITEQVVEVDETLTEKYLGGQQPTHDELHNAFEKALREAHLTPICFVSTRTGAGVNELLRFIVELCPSPLEGNPRPFVTTEADGTEKPYRAEPDPSKKAVAHVFKITSDPFVGKLAFFRVHQGTIRHNSSILRNDDKKPLRVGHIFHVKGKEHEEVHELVAGDIGAVAKLEELHAGDVLHESSDVHGLHLTPLPMPQPMYGLGITPKSRGDETKLSSAIHKLQAEDPTFRVERVSATKQTVARGIGELHLRVILEKMKNHFGVEVDTVPQKVAYKETIASKADGHHRHKKQTGGAGQFGEVYLRVEPLPTDHETGFEFVDDTFGGSVPKQFMPAIEKGVKRVMEEGAIAGYPMFGIRVCVTDGKHHPVDSKEIAFVTAGRRAFIDAVQKARPVLLEPWVRLEVMAPSKHMGDLTSDIAGKRGRVQSSNIAPGDSCVIEAIAPLSEVLLYSNQLKSITAGTGTYSMEFSHNEQTPPQVQAEVVAAYKPRAEEE